ncbi:MAG: O-antigen ligase family protein [Candidatus Omnitrophica bacterium]|nr:O-antigen ligase family protein [Candidatus Omnitrophota bacterium]
MDIQTKQKTIAIIDKLAFFFFAALVFFLPIAIAAVESLFGFIFLCFIVKAILLKPSWHTIKGFFKNRINLSVLVFYIVIGLTIAVSGPFFYKSFKAWFFKWGEGVLLFFFAQVLLDKKKIKILLYVLAASSFLMVLDGLYQKFTGIDFIRKEPIVRTEQFSAIKASFNHYNGFATFLIVVFFVSSGFFISLKKLWLKFIFLVLSFLIVVCLLFTYSRGSWLSFAIVNFLLIVLISDNKKRVLFSLFLLIFAFSIFYIPFLRDRFIFILERGGDADRFKVWLSAINMFKESPLLGKGLGTFMANFPEYQGVAPQHRLNPQYAHNCYLQILAETGILGLFSFLWVIWEVLRSGFMRFVPDKDYLFLGLYVGLIAFLIHIFFDTQLYSVNLSIMFWLLMSFLGVKLAPLSAKEAA